MLWILFLFGYSRFIFVIDIRFDCCLDMLLVSVEISGCRVW